MSAEALVKVVLPEMRVPRPVGHTSHSQGAFLRSLGRQGLVTGVLLSRGWGPRRGCHLLPCLRLSVHLRPESVHRSQKEEEDGI